MQRFSILFLTFLLIGCTSQPVNAPNPAASTSVASMTAEAHDTLVNFLTLLHTKSYTEAAPLYGGEYEQLRTFNTDIHPADYVALWTWACDNQLLQCLEVRSATFKELRGNTYVFQVEFDNPDGSLFVLGPCCGATETEMPPVSQFEYTVTRTADGKFVVMEPPPYVP